MMKFMEIILKKIYTGSVFAIVLSLFLFGCLSTSELVGGSQKSQVQEESVLLDQDLYSEDEALATSFTSDKKERKQAEKLYKGAGLTIAVLPPELRGGEPWMKQSFQDNLTSLLAGYTDMTVLDRKNEDLIIAQQELSETGLYSEENAVEIGQMTNAQYVVVGSIQKLSASYECNFRVNETATNEIRSASISRHSLADMESGVAVRQIVQELFGGLGIQLTKAEQTALQKKNDVESTSITMLAKGDQAQASEDYIQAVLYYNQVEGAFQQEAQASTTRMLSVTHENLTVHQRQQYYQTQQAKWKKILEDLQTYLDENLWIGVYHDPLVVKETDVSMNRISYEVPLVMKVFPNRQAVIVAKKVMEEWYKVQREPDNKVWAKGVVVDDWRFDITVGLFDADGNQLIDDDYEHRLYDSCYSRNLRDFVFELFSSSNPADYVIRSQKKYFDDAKYLVNSGSIHYKTGVMFKNIEIQDMSENTVLPTAGILKIEGTNDPYSSKKQTCKLTLYTMEEWEALMAQE